MATATATVTNSASAAQQILELRLRDLEKIELKYTTSSKDLEKVTDDLASERRTIDAIEKQYSEACVLAARGDTKADPAAILAEKDRRSHRIKGLEQLVSQGSAALALLTPEYRGAQVAVADAQNALKLEQLEAEITEAQAKRHIANVALSEAERVLSVAVYARTMFLRHQGRA
jgi:hypothetical protein